jgi:hypothetical protein
LTNPYDVAAAIERVDDHARLVGARIELLTSEDCGITDTFDRETPPNGGGISDATIPWNLLGAQTPPTPMQATVSISNRMVITHAVEANSNRYAGAGLFLLLNPAVNTVDVTFEVQLENAPVANGDSIWEVLLGGTGDEPVDRGIRVIKPTFGGGAESWLLFNEDGEGPTHIILGGFGTANWKVHLLSTNDTFRAKVWLASDPEPIEWQETLTNTTPTDGGMDFWYMHLPAVNDDPNFRNTVYYETLDIVGVNRCTYGE